MTITCFIQNVTIKKYIIRVPVCLLILFQKNNGEIRPANQARNGYLIANDEEVRESESCSSVHEKVK